MIHEICEVLKQHEIEKDNIYKLFNDFNIFEILEEELYSVNKKANTSKEKPSDTKMEIETQPELSAFKIETTIINIITLSLA